MTVLRSAERPPACRSLTSSADPGFRRTQLAVVGLLVGWATLAASFIAVFGMVWGSVVGVWGLAFVLVVAGASGLLGDAVLSRSEVSGAETTGPSIDVTALASEALELQRVS